MADILAFPSRRHDAPTVLVVDDEFLMRGVLTEILQDSGFRVLAAASADDAIALLNGQDVIDLVFSDIKMPGPDGFSLARWVHQNKPGMPVILASGYSGKTNMAAELREAEFLRKPCDFEMIVTKIRETIARKQTCRA